MLRVCCRRFRVFIAATLMLALVATGALQVSAEPLNAYSVTDLGTLPGGTFAPSAAINAAGQIVGQSDVAFGAWHSFMWQKSVMTDLGTLPGLVGFAAALNNRGQIVGMAEPPGIASARAWAWHNGVIIDLGTLPAATQAAATGINDAGQIVGSSFGSCRPGACDAWLWQNGAMTDLGTINGACCSFANGINNAGQVVGSSDGRAFL